MDTVLTDERMKEFSDILGEAYAQEKDAIGDTDTPGSMAFEIDKLNKYIDGVIPNLGILSGFEITLHPMSVSQLDIASGIVVYNGTQYSIDSTTVDITKTFQYDYSASNQYGFIIAFNKNDLNSNSVSFKSKLSTSLTGGVSTYIEIDDVDLLSYTPPFFITIDGEEIEIWSINSSDQCLIAPHYNSGKVVNNHNSGAPVFINKPLIPENFLGYQ